MKKILLALIHFYQKVISPLKPASCRFYPCCSQYAVQAFSKHGVIKGGILTIWRILRCNPWNLGGIDYVPQKFYLVPFKGNCRSKTEE